MDSLRRVVLTTSTIAFLASSLSGCVRYYPSRNEMNKPYGADPAIEYVGEDAFYLYDTEQRSRLETLIHERIKSTPDTWDTAYKIGPGDKVNIEVKSFEEVSKEYKVNLDGVIKLPFVGKVEVTGLTEEELSNQIAKIVQDFVLEPQVHVEVIDHSAHKVWVVGGGFRGTATAKGETGEIQDSRAYPLRRPNYSLVELLVEIGMADKLATGGVIYLYPQGTLHSGAVLSKEELLNTKRTTVQDRRFSCAQHNNPGWLNTEAGDTSEQQCSGYNPALARQSLGDKYHQNARIMIDLEELFGGNRQAPLYVPLRPGDSIFVPTAPIIQVFGEVNKRGTYAVNDARDGFSGGVNSVKPSLMSVFAEAQGLTYAADIHNIEIYRELEFGKKVVMAIDFEKISLRGTQDIRLRDGDIIWVPSQSGRFIEFHSINAVNEALGIGNRAYVTGQN